MENILDFYCFILYPVDGIVNNIQQCDAGASK
jgi:hypothetical protein